MRINWLGAEGGRMNMIFNHLAYVRVSWSNGQKFLTMTMAKISKLPWSNGQNWSILTIDLEKIPGFHGHGQFLTIDHGVNSRVSSSVLRRIIEKLQDSLVCKLFNRRIIYKLPLLKIFG